MSTFVMPADDIPPEWPCLPVDDLPIVSQRKTPWGTIYNGRVQPGDRVTIAKPCEKCHGIGLIGAGQCLTCDGTGSVPVWTVEIDKIVPGRVVYSIHEASAPDPEPWGKDTIIHEGETGYVFLGDGGELIEPTDLPITEDTRYAVYFKPHTWETA